MAELRLGWRVTFNGRAFEIIGFTAMSVKRGCVFLRDLETGERIVVRTRELAAEAWRRPSRNGYTDDRA